VIAIVTLFPVLSFSSCGMPTSEFVRVRTDRTTIRCAAILTSSWVLTSRARQHRRPRQLTSNAVPLASDAKETMLLVLVLDATALNAAAAVEL